MEVFSLCIFLVLISSLQGCGTKRTATIAFIPRATGSLLWESAHGGAEEAAGSSGSRIYWNAATREDDIDGQITLVNQELQRNCVGLILAPSHALALITPVRKAIGLKIPTVIIGSPLSIPPGSGLYYILNDEELGGRIAAERVGLMLHGKGTVAVLGIDPAIVGVTIRARSFERVLAANFPKINIVDRRSGSFSRQHEQQMTEEVLTKRRDLDAIVALNWTTAYEALSWIESRPGEYTARVIAFDPESLPFAVQSLDSIILEDTRSMGELAVRLITSRRQGRSVPLVTTLAPILVTRENVESDRIRQLTTPSWQPEKTRRGAPSAP